jgi:antitoxin HigA-1
MTIHKPLHPGEIIREILIEGANLSVIDAAKKLDVNRTTLSRLLNGRAGISADMALRLSKLLPNTDILLWMNLQRDYDVWQIRKHSKEIYVKPLKHAA